MTDKKEIGNENKTINDKTQKNERNEKNKERKSEWKGFFEEVTYSNGTGDNIFIYG